MKRTITALSITAALFMVLALIGCATAKAETSYEEPKCFAAVKDNVDMALNAKQFRERLAVWHEEKQAEIAAREAEEAAQAALEEQAYWESLEYYYEPSGGSGSVGYRGNPNGLNNFNGVNEFNGKTETFYGTSAVYDDQLWVDDDGFWRTDEGYYVVASEDYEQGEHIQISQGEAVVMDGGCEPGVVDVHVSGWN